MNKPWPRNIKTEKYGNLIAVHQDYVDFDYAWQNTYRRIEDGKYFTFTSLAPRTDLNSDLDFILESQFDKVFLQCDEIKLKF